MFPDRRSVVRDETFGLRCWQGSPRPMAAAHRHDEIEVNVVTAGEITYLFGGTTVRIGAGTTAAFWATMPHQLVAASPGSRSLWLTVPLPLVLGWSLAPEVRTALLSTTPVTGRSVTAAAVDEAVFLQWADDLAAGGERAAIAQLEMQARLRRLVAQRRGTTSVESSGTSALVGSADRAAAQAAAMAAFIARHHAEPIGPDDVAAAVHLHPHHAMTIFRRVVGDTIGGYLARCRVAQAQRLLLSTSLPATTVGHEVGFASTSRFYSVFTGIVGTPPGRYRQEASRP